jgi:3-methyl-2-oxobutanoate hydroxymethyltransferase
MVAAVRAYADEVRGGAFPAREHTYAIPPEELQRFQGSLAQIHGAEPSEVEGHPA